MHALTDTLAPAPAQGRGLGRPSADNGVWQGIRVQATSVPSALGDGAEEASLHFAHQVEIRTHAERRIQAVRRPAILSVDQVRDYLEKAHRTDALVALAASADALLKCPDQTSIQQMLDRVATGDPTLRYLLLQYARSSGPVQGATPQVLARLDEAITVLNDQSGDVIQAHLATVEYAARHATSPEEIRQFQGSVQALLGQPTLALALKEVIALAQGSETGLQSAVDNLMRALGACLPLLGPAREKALLQTLITDLYHLKSLKTAFAECRALVSWLKLHLLATSSPEKDADAPCGQGSA